LTGAIISFRKSGKVPVKGLIGNPVRIGSGPAAVILPLFNKGNLFSKYVPLFR